MIKKFGTDLLGILLIIAALLLGWIPGPGGIPLLVLGLGLLSIHHTWARRWLKQVEKHGANISGKVFREHSVWKIILDVLGVISVVGSIWLFIYTSHNLRYAVAFGSLCLGTFLLLGNRKRLQHLKRHFKAQA